MILNAGDDRMAEEFEGTIITLSDEDGNSFEFELLDTMEMDDKTYVALVAAAASPEEVLENDGELVILELAQDDDGEVFIPIEDEQIFDKVAAEFESRLAEEFDFEG